MPRYYFDVHDGEGTFVDEVGMDLANMNVAIDEARRALADMVADVLRERAGGELHVRIRDGADGPVVLSVTLSTQTPHGPGDVT